MFHPESVFYLLTFVIQAMRDKNTAAGRHTGRGLEAMLLSRPIGQQGVVIP